MNLINTLGDMGLSNPLEIANKGGRTLRINNSFVLCGLGINLFIMLQMQMNKASTCYITAIKRNWILLFYWAEGRLIKFTHTQKSPKIK